MVYLKIYHVFWSLHSVIGINIINIHVKYRDLAIITINLSSLISFMLNIFICILSTYIIKPARKYHNFCLKESCILMKWRKNKYINTYIFVIYLWCALLPDSVFLCYHCCSPWRISSAFLSVLIFMWHILLASFCLKMSLFCLLSWRILTLYIKFWNSRLLGSSFFFHYFNDVIPLPSAFIVSEEKIAVIWIIVTWTQCDIFLWLLQYFLSTFGFL